ncbi:hypothetical protein SADUNF_Sadunf11G0091800 [Salix dunnii]|uniref:non-specific serine/threonine protein kinase n=1 Tax=Salix dunnii TaxID=1413687 RepID=A0A835MX82_9ROSI|nr:hypothetical protein SADUNF_Sadunf11G0091800 [Salix dunnii]
MDLMVMEKCKGVLVLYNSTNDIVWSSISSRTAANPVAELLESGNLVVREENDSNPENFLWQSFDHPCDTLIFGMKLGSNFVTKIDKFLSSWRSAEDPAPGEYSFLIDTHGYPQLLLKSGNKTLFRAGPWNGIKFVSNPRPVTVSNEFVFNSKEVYYQFAIQSSRLTISPSGLPQSYTWNDRTNDWAITDVGQYDQCENYAFCGPNTRCEMSRSPICVCLDRFVPKSLADWNFSDWSGGCIRRTPLECSDKVGFLKYTGMKLPDTSSSWYNKSISLKECERLCLKNCSCTAYANLDVRNGGSGCLIWFGDLIDTRRSTGDGQDLYVRMNATELGVLTKKRIFNKRKLAGIVSSAIVSGIGMLVLGFIFSKRKRNLRKKKHWEARQEDMELPIFDMSTIAHATDTFSDSNKLGEGGFGPVYKAWMLWIKGTPLELIDECLAESSNSSEIIRCIHVALLCVQQRPEDRPNMSAVVVILGSDMPLPQPKQPGFFMGENPYEQSTSSNKHEPYSGDETVLWVANRETPFSDRFGVLNITREGILILYSRSSSIVWLSNSSRTAENPVAELLESGNLVVREENDKNPANFLWQSFDYPCDTMLPGMKLGINFVTRLESSVTSWKSSEDPARGEFSFLLDPNGYPQLVLKKGNITLVRAGSWNGIRFTAQTKSKPDSISTDEFVLNEKEGYFVFGNTSLGFPRLTLTPGGIPQRSIWNDRTHQWQFIEIAQIDICERYSICGPNAYCHVNNSPICACLDGFMPRSPRDWKLSNWSGGCVRRTPCSDKDRFQNYSRMKLPDTSSSWYNKSIGLEECKGICLKNCSCSAYANLDVRGGGSGCLIWFGGLIDTRRSNGDGQDLYVRIAISDLENIEKKRPVDKKKQAVIIASSVILVLDQNLNLLGHAWILWTKGAQLDLIDECLSDSHVSVEVLRCIHVALLCVQQRPEDRPTMSSVVVMLGSENPLPQPKQPGFFMEKNPPEQGNSSSKHESYSANEVTLTSLEAR